MKLIYKVQNFIEDWIYPAYYLRNTLFHRYDRVKFPSIKSYEFLEDGDRMFYAVFELIHNFVNHLDTNYTLWKGQDKDGKELGPVYGDSNSGENILYPELKGKYVIDLIHEIDDFYTKDLKKINDDITYMQHIESSYFSKVNWNNFLTNKENNDIETYSLNVKYNDYTNEELDKLDINWDRILPYTNNLTKYDLKTHTDFLKALVNVENYCFNKKQYYLHLAIEVRNYLWS